MATSDFGKAFRAAREAGDKEFEFGGKKYNTKMKDEDSAPAKKDTPAKDTSNYSNEGRGSKPISKPSTDFTPGKVPSSEQAATNRAAAVDKVKSVASGVGDYLSNTFSMEGREQAKKEGRERYGMKKGGAVSASRRGDGIAQRGKTRGKMC